MRELYRHTQFGKGMFWALAMVLVMDAVFVVMIVSHAGAEPWLVAVLGVTMILMPVLLLNYAYLTVTVTKKQIRLRFGKGPFGRKVPISRVRGIERTEIPWYRGMGVKWTREGWIYNVSCADAVKVELDDGKSIRIGTDEPAKLIRAIERARGEAGRSE